MKPSRTTRLRVLTYHRVARPRERADLDPRLISATPEAFERQMRLLRRSRAVVSIGEVLSAAAGRDALPPKAVLVTFDDAYEDLADHAFPILRGLGLPALVFVPTSFPDRPERSFRADRLHRAFSSAARPGIETAAGTLRLASPRERSESLRLLSRHLKTLSHAEAESAVDAICAELMAPRSVRSSVLSWERLRQLPASGIAVAAHGRSHALLTQVPDHEIRAEIAGSRDDLVREMGSALPVFCYPNGSHDERAVAALREAGFELAFTTRDGENDLASCDRLRLRRTNITSRTTALLLRARLTPWGARIDEWRHRGEAGNPGSAPA